MPQNTLTMGIILSTEERTESKISKQFFYIRDQGWPTYGTHAQSGTQKDFLATRHSLLSHFLNPFCPSGVSKL
jgi:hypothetical protein